MSQLTDRNYLLNSQYRDPSNLNARVRLHERFSTNLVGWYSWVFQQLDLPECSLILEVGCGPGFLWLENLVCFPPGWQVFLTDFSPGMATAAAKQFVGRKQFYSAALDIQDMALPAECVDAVIANHMLYHVPDMEHALDEIWRVLKPGGRIFATTNGQNHLLELREFVNGFDLEDGAIPPRGDAWEQVSQNFSLENGRDILSPWFSGIELKSFDDALEITEVEPIVSFVESSTLLGVDPDKLEAFRLFLEGKMLTRGVIYITKDSGLFTAIKD